jgi:S-adenosylmethionine hydrolase
MHGKTFGDAEAGGVIVYEDSAGTVAVAINAGNAAQALGVEADGEIVLAPCP